MAKFMSWLGAAGVVGGYLWYDDLQFCIADCSPNKMPTYLMWAGGIVLLVGVILLVGAWPRKKDETQVD